MKEKPNFNELCEEKAKAGDKHALYILKRAQETSEVPLRIAIDYEIKRLESYERAGIGAYKTRTITGEEQVRTVDQLRTQIKRAEELGMLDGSLSMTYEGAKKVYERVREIVGNKTVKDETGASVNVLNVIDLCDSVRDADLIASALFLDPEVRKYVDDRAEGLYKTVLNIGSHKRIGYALPTRSFNQEIAQGEALPPFLKKLLATIPEAKTSEEEHHQRALKLLIHQRAERDVFPVFKRNVAEGFSRLENLLKRENNPHLNEEYEKLKKAYHNYIDFEVLGVNPDFVDPTTGKKGVLPALHQRMGIYGIINEQRFGIWDGGGTGKTAIPVLAQPLIERKLADQGRAFNRTIIVGPGDRFKEAWRKGLVGSDTERYLAEKQNIFVMNGEKKTDRLLDEMAKAKWIITNYEQLITRTNGGDKLFVDTLTDLGADLVIFDEVHNVKGLKTTTRGGKTKDPTLTWSAAARQLGLIAPYFAALSATPISNGMDDFAVLYHLINPTECKDPKEFAREIGDNPRKLYSFFNQKSVRRNSEDINEELEHTEKTNAVEMDPIQKQIYDHILLQRPGNWMIQARKALVDPRLVDPEILKRAGVLGQVTHRNSAKYKALEALITAEDGPLAQGDKFVIFSMLMDGVTQEGNATLQRRYAEIGSPEQYEKLQLDLPLDKLLAKAIKEKLGKNAEVGVIDGSVDTTERDLLIKRLGSDDGLVGMVCTTKAGGESLNFTAANWCYFLDRDYKPDTEEQAIWRELRRGQKKKVNIRHLKIKDSIYEAEVDRTVEEKKMNAQIAMDGHALTKKEQDLFDDEEAKRRLGQRIVRGLGGISINVSDAPLKEISDFEARVRTSREAKHYGTGVMDYTTTKAQEVMRWIGNDPVNCWKDPDFVKLYMEALDNLAVPVMHCAKVCDLVSRANNGEVRFPKKVLSEGSGPSLLYNAYQHLAPIIASQGHTVPTVWDRDFSQLMLDQGSNPNKILGDMTGKDSTIKSGSFDMVDHESITLLRNPDEVKDALTETNRILKPNGLVEILLKNKRFSEEFPSAVEKLGFKVLTRKNEGLYVSKPLLNRMKEERGAHFAESYAAKLANTYMMIGQKISKPSANIKADDLWFETIHPDPEDKVHEQISDSLEIRGKEVKIKKEPRAKITETNDFIHLADSSGNVHSVRKKHGEDKHE